jgi:hypothetical protein
VTRIITPGVADRRSRSPLLSRLYVEAQLIAVATIRHDVAGAASRRALRSHLSPNALALLDAIAFEPADAWACLSLLAENEVQWQLANDAQAMTLGEMTFHSVGTLLALARGPLHQSDAAHEVAA